jgi:RsiW-degrading membrane proteinase PrsW (M82 family)
MIQLRACGMLSADTYVHQEGVGEWLKYEEAIMAELHDPIKSQHPEELTTKIDTPSCDRDLIMTAVSYQPRPNGIQVNAPRATDDTLPLPHESKAASDVLGTKSNTWEGILEDICASDTLNTAINYMRKKAVAFRDRVAASTPPTEALRVARQTAMNQLEKMNGSLKNGSPNVGIMAKPSLEADAFKEDIKEPSESHPANSPSVTIDFDCPHCDVKISAESRHAGTTSKCPSCQWDLTVPFDETPETAPAESPEVIPQARSTPEPAIDTAVALDFSMARLLPLLICNLLFGWITSMLLPARFFICDNLIGQVMPVAMLAVPALTLAILGICVFIRPVRFPQRQAIGALFFTMLVGLVGLLLFQQLAEFCLHWHNRNLGKANGLVLIFKVIGQAYQSIHSTSVFEKLFGYIAGVGFCEETTKLLPLFYLIFRDRTRTGEPDYRSFLIVGFFSGLGFGIGEAIYAYAPWSKIPNPIYASNVIRWFACVPSHGIYTVIDAAFLWLLAPMIRKTKGVYRQAGICALVVLCAAILHGIYDVLGGNLFVNISLDGAAIALMYFVVDSIAKKTMQTGIATKFDSGIEGRLLEWVSKYKNGNKHLRNLYFFAGFIIICSSVFSSSAEEYQRRVSNSRSSSDNSENTSYQSNRQKVRRGAYDIYMQGYNDPQQGDIMKYMIEHGNMSESERDMAIILIAGAEDKKQNLPVRFEVVE